MSGKPYLRLQAKGLVTGLLLAMAVAAAMGQVLFVSRLVLNSACTIRTGAGSPEGSVTGAICDVYLQTDGGAGTTLWVKESGSGNTGWSGGGGAGGAITGSGLTMATARLLGRTTAGTGAIEEIAVGSGLSLSAGTLSASSTPALEYDAGNSSTALTVNWSNGVQQIVTLTDNVTFTFSNPTAGQVTRLILVQDAGGTNTVTWPASVKWEGGTAPTIFSASNVVTLCAFAYTELAANGYLGTCNATGAYAQP